MNDQSENFLDQYESDLQLISCIAISTHESKVQVFYMA